jgi:predicted TIM-barrel fold metal-dependent hydrolase
MNAITSMLTVDAQIHLWEPDRPGRPWPEWGKTHHHRPGNPLGADEALDEMARAGVGRAVLVPPSFEGEYNDVVLRAAAEHPDKFAVMGRLDLAAPEGERADLSSWLAQPGMLGARLVFTHRGREAWLDDGTADWFWPAAEKHGVPVMVFAPGMHDRLADVARSHPRLRLIVDHLGIRSDVFDVPLLPLVEPLFELSRLPNVAVKASALPCFVKETFPFPSLQELIRETVRAFGAERTFWGSDISRLPCPYRDLVRLFSVKLDFLSDTEREEILGKGITTWLNWK